jgi:hypothetical protein
MMMNVRTSNPAAIGTRSSVTQYDSASDWYIATNTATSGRIVVRSCVSARRGSGRS